MVTRKKESYTSAGKNGLIWDKRPREYAEPIAEKARVLIREELKEVPKEARLITAKHIVSGLSRDYYVKPD